MKKRLRKEVKILLIVLVFMLCGFFFFRILNTEKSAEANHGNNSGSSNAEIIENEGDIEIVIPEEMDDGGF